MLILLRLQLKNINKVKISVKEKLELFNTQKFENLYLKHKEAYSDKFEICLTEVSANNLRSMRAHEKVGFQTIHKYRDTTDDWNIILWSWGE